MFEPGYGLALTVVKDADSDGVVDSGERIVARHRVGTLDVNWGSGGETADAADSFIAEWAGKIAAPASGWQLGIECDQKATVEINGSAVAGSPTTGCSAVSTSGAIDWLTGTLSTTPQSVKVRLVETTGAAMARLWVRQGTGTPTRIQTSWLTTRDPYLPVGWELSAGPAALEFVRAVIDGDSLTLQAPDGSSVVWQRDDGSSSTQGWQPESGDDGFASQGTDGTIAVSWTGLTYLFNTDGSLRQAVTSTDDQNRSTAATYSYDASGRPVTIQDPVNLRQLKFIYQGQTGCSASPIPTGYLCAFQFSVNGSSPETWSTLAYSSSSPTATLTSFTNYPDAAHPNDLDKNQTWQFGYQAGSGDTGGWMNSYRDPLAYDAIRSGIWTGSTSTTTWDMVFDGNAFGAFYWGWPESITGPAPTVGSTRPVFTIDNAVVDNNHVGFTDIRTGIAGTSPSAGYATRYGLDDHGRAENSYDASGLVTTVEWNVDDQIVKTVDPTGRQTRLVYDKAGNPAEEWGPIPASNTACLSALDARSNTAAALPSQCVDVPLVKTDYDLDIATGAEFVGLDATYWANTNLAPSGAEERPALNTLGIGGSGGSVDVGWGSGGPSNLKNAAGTAVVDNFSVELTGVLVFPSSGTFTLKLEGNDLASLWLDDELVIENADSSGKTASFPATADTRYRIRITLVETTGTSRIKFLWTPAGGSEVVVPGSALHPNYRYATRVRTFDGSGAVADEQTYTLPTPQYGTVSEASANGLETTNTFESAGSGWGRELTRTLPAGNTWTNTYYVGSLSATTCGVASGTSQSGLLRQRLGPDPDGAGSGKRRIEEFVYDIYGNQRGTRVGTEGATANELDSTVTWACMATVDGANRALTLTYPASASDPARTVWVDYAKDGNPLVAEICDNNVSGSPNGSSDTCSGRNGVITATVDLLGRSTVYTDVWGKTTTLSYNQAGDLTARVGPNGTETFEYTVDGQIWKHKLGATTLAEVTYNAAGDVRSVAYSNSTSLADLDASGRRFSDQSIKELTFTGPGGTITTNTITERDRNGRVLKETSDGKEYRYAYDSFDRLVRTEFGATGFVTADDDWQYCYQDHSGANGAAPACTASDVGPTGANGNRVAAYLDGSKTAGYTFDDSDRLTSVSTQSPYAGQALGYDSRGNTTSIAGESLTYDGADRHTGTSKGAYNVSYQRDALNRIVSRTGTDGTSRYSYGGGGDRNSSILNTSSVLTQSLFPLPGGVLLAKTSTIESWNYPNLQGSVSAVADSSGAKQGSTYRFDPFGGGTAQPDNSNGDFDYGYLGSTQRPVDHNVGLRQQIEMGARVYDPQIGRFLQVDPVVGGCSNDYVYVKGDPRSQTDLSGRWTCPIGWRLDPTMRWMYVLSAPSTGATTWNVPNIWYATGLKFKVTPISALAIEVEFYVGGRFQTRSGATRNGHTFYLQSSWPYLVSKYGSVTIKIVAKVAAVIENSRLGGMAGPEFWLQAWIKRPTCYGGPVSRMPYGWYTGVPGYPLRVWARP